MILVNGDEKQIPGLKKLFNTNVEVFWKHIETPSGQGCSQRGPPGHSLSKKNLDPKI